MKIAIYGAGSLGTILGAYLSKAGLEVDLITRNQEHVKAVNQNGAHVTGTTEMIVPVHTAFPEKESSINTSAIRRLIMDNLIVIFS